MTALVPTLRRLAGSSTVRLVALIAGVFLAAALALAVAVTTTVAAYVEDRIVEALRGDAAGLEDVWREAGLDALARTVERRRTADPGDGRVHLVVAADGSRIAGDFAAWPNDLATDGDIVRFRGARDGMAYTGVVRHIAEGPDLLVAHDRRAHRAVMTALARDLAVPIGLALVLALIVTAVAGRRLLARVERINATARAVEAGDLTARVPGEGADEFGRLATHVNAMLDRIATLMRGVHGLSDHIAHETRTPLARLRTRLERARRTATTDPAALPPMLDDAVAESTELIAVFSALLDIARTEAAAGDSRGLAPVDLADIVTEMVDLYEAVAEERGVRLAATIAPATVLGERLLIARMIANLIDNAVKFSPDGAAIDIMLDRSGDEVRLVVRDRGPGLPQGFEATAFDRFTRGDNVGVVPGHGLGLPLVRAVAMRHGMKIALEPAEPGLRIVVRAHAAPAA